MEDKASNKALNFLESNGLVQAYEYLLTSLCEHGLPTGDLYEFSALMVLKFEKKWKAKNRQNKPKAQVEISQSRKIRPDEAYEQETSKIEDKAQKPKENGKNKPHEEAKAKNDEKKNKEEEKKHKEEEKKPKAEEKKGKLREEEKKVEEKKGKDGKKEEKVEEKKGKDGKKEEKVGKKEEEKKPKEEEKKPRQKK